MLAEQTSLVPSNYQQKLGEIAEQEPEQEVLESCMSRAETMSVSVLSTRSTSLLAGTKRKQADSDQDYLEECLIEIPPRPRSENPANTSAEEGRDEEKICSNSYPSENQTDSKSCEEVWRKYSKHCKAKVQRVLRGDLQIKDISILEILDSI